MRLARFAPFVVLLAASGCVLEPYHSTPPPAPSHPQGRPGGGPVITSTPEVLPAPPATEPGTMTPAPSLPRERPHVQPATLGPASKSLVAQAQAQRRKGDLPGATVSLERALRIEPNNPLLWIEMGRLRMDQRNFPQAEAMARKALAMSVGDNRTQGLAWQVIADSLKARGRNPQAEEAAGKARELLQN